MWILILAAYLPSAPLPEAKAIVIGVFPTARECISTKKDMSAMLADDADNRLNSYGLDCVKVDADVVPKKAQAPRS